MLIVKPILKKENQEEICAACGAVYDADLLACAAHEDDQLLGFCQFAFSGSTAVITDLRPKLGVDDFEAMFILGRGTLNYIDLCGIHYARCLPSAGDLSLIRAIGFKENDQKLLEMDLTDQFTGKCSHCK